MKGCIAPSAIATISWIASPNKRRIASVIFSVVLVGASVRAYRLGHQSLWADEVHTVINSDAPLLKVLTRPEPNPNTPTLYYLLIYAVLAIGNRESLLRLPSMVLGSLSILLLYFVLHRWLGKVVGIIGAMIMAVSPFHVWYSQEARPYALLVFLSLLSLWLVQQLLEGRTNRWLRAGFVISTALTFYCHTVGIAFIGFVGALVLLAVPREKWKDWLGLFAAIALLVAPAVYQLVVTPPVNSANPYRRLNPLQAFAYMIWAFGAGYTLGPTVDQLHMPDRMRILLPHLPIMLTVTVFFAGLLLLGMSQLQKRDRVISWSITLWFIFPLAFALLGAAITVHPFNVRYAILSLPPFIALLALGTQSFSVGWVRTVTLGMIGLISIISLGNYFLDERYQRENNRAAGQLLSAHALPNDLVIAIDGYTAVSLRHYYQGETVRIEGYSLTPASFSKPERIASDLHTMVGGDQRFWVFFSRIYDNRLREDIRKLFEDGYRRELDASWTGTELILFRRSSDS
jgi:mannosyltransferase